jgi:hypothetical protein
MMRNLVGAAFLSIVFASTVAAQTETKPAATAVKPLPPPSGRVQIVVSRYNGDKKVATQPYELVTVANGSRKAIRIGAEVPIDGGVPTEKGGTTPYKNIGTNIVCDLSYQEDGRFLLSLHITSSSLYPDDKRPGARPSFRTFMLEGMAYLRDGQTAEIATATDSLTGEVIKADVTIRTIK